MKLGSPNERAIEKKADPSPNVGGDIGGTTTADPSPNVGGDARLDDGELYDEKVARQYEFAKEMLKEEKMKFGKDASSDVEAEMFPMTTSPPPGLHCRLLGNGIQSGDSKEQVVYDIGGLVQEIAGINGVEEETARKGSFKAECDWQMSKSKTFEDKAKREEELMIQNLEGNPTKICIDSGAGESVCPIDSFPEYETMPTDKVGNTYLAAGGQELTNVGEKRPQFRTNGIHTQMAFQSTTQVKKPLAAASKITAKGNRIVLDGLDSISYIENKATGVRIPLKIENGVYVMEVAVERKPVPFQRPAR